MERKAKADVDSGWQSSCRGESAWKEETDRIAARNADAQKAGRVERQAYEREREEAGRKVAAKRQAELLKSHNA